MGAPCTWSLTLPNMYKLRPSNACSSVSLNQVYIRKEKKAKLRKARSGMEKKPSVRAAQTVFVAKCSQVHGAAHTAQCWVRVVAVGPSDCKGAANAQLCMRGKGADLYSRQALLCLHRRSRRLQNHLLSPCVLQQLLFLQQIPPNL